jgi:membrane associated rhomboid family serine protease
MTKNVLGGAAVLGYKRYAYVALLSVATLFDTARVLIQRDISTSYAAHFGGWIWGVLSGLFMLRHSLGGRLQLHEVSTWKSPCISELTPYSDG